MLTLRHDTPILVWGVSNLLHVLQEAFNQERQTWNKKRDRDNEVLEEERADVLKDLTEQKVHTEQRLVCLQSIFQ